MHHPLTTTHACPLLASRAHSCIAFALLLAVAVSPVAASATLFSLPLTASLASASSTNPLPPLASAAPWVQRCYTDTCIGVLVTFATGHAVAIGYPSDYPGRWTLMDSSDLTADEMALAIASVDALIHRDLPTLATTYPALPPWYLDRLAAALAPNPPYMLFLPVIRC